MFLSRCNCVIFLLVLFSIFMPNNSNPTFISNYCLDPTNRTDEATFQSNLTSLLDSLSSKSAVYSFYNYSIFSSFYGLFLCRGDVSSDICRSCIKTAIQEAKTRCGQNTTAIIWYDECMLRYSKDNFFGQPQTLPLVLAYNQNNRTAPNQPNIDATSLMYPLIRNASLSTMLFNASEQRGGSQNNYGLVQCTRDLDGDSCSSCLSQLMDEANRCCQEKIGWQMRSPSCSIRYENYSFFASPAAAPDGTVGIAAAALTPAGGGGGKNTAKIIPATVIPAIVVAAMVVFLYHLHSSKKRQSSTGGQSSIQVPLTTEGLDRSNSRTSLLPDQGMNAANENDNVEVYELMTISFATNNFSEENKLGQGGFGSVYEGTLANGKKIAVKRLSPGSKQGLVQFKTEVMVIAKLRHINLVRLLGWCNEGNEMLLVYEYMINKSLDVFLSDPDKRKTLDWHTRASIIKGIARGIEYLHGRAGNQIVIHRDLKTSNVLLDEKMNPKISDFGIAKMFGDELNEAYTNTPMGTVDYMAPEYKNEGNYGTETDVYSFGVMLLEIVSGKSCSAFRESNRGESLLTYARKLCREGKELELMDELVDPLVVNNCQTTASRLIRVGVCCAQDNPDRRPTMSQVVIWLEIESTPELSAPFSCLFSEGQSSTSSTRYDTASLTFAIASTSYNV